MAMQKFTSPNLPLPPNQYDPQYFNMLIRSLNAYFQQAGSTTPVVFDSITLTNLPTSSVGLRSGSIWNDANTLKIVP